MKTLLLSLTLILSALLYTNVAADDGITKQQAVDIVKQQHPGRVLGVKRRSGVYKVKTLSESGKVRITNVDADSGKITSGRKAKK